MEEQLLDVRGTRVQMFVDGDGPPVLFLHGAGGGGWTPGLGLLARRFRVYAPTHPGFPGADSRDAWDTVEDYVFHYLDVLDTLGLDRVHLLGQSLGGWMAAEFASRHAHRLHTLVLLSAAGLRERPHWSGSGESLVRIAKCCSAMGLFYNKSPELQQAECPGFDLSRKARLGLAHAEKLWARLDRESIIEFLPPGVHSDDVVAIDGDGNMVSLCHSINCLIWGRTAILVDGVSIGDPASYLQPLVAATPRGAQPMAPGLASRLRNGSCTSCPTSIRFEETALQQARSCSKSDQQRLRAAEAVGT